MHTARRTKVSLRAVPVHQQPPALALGQHIEAAHRDGRRILERLNEPLQRSVHVDADAIRIHRRLHLYGQRSEETWDIYLDILRVEEEVFPDGSSPWIIGTPYWGEGPYLGQKGKYEVLMLPTPGTQVAYLKKEFGLSVEKTQKWNIVERDTLFLITNLLENNLKNDGALHGHLAFNLVHNFVDGYKHYSYDTPLWLKEGLAHHVERRLNPRYNSFSFAEGSVADVVNKSDWEAEAKKLIQSGKAPRLANLVNLRSFADFDDKDHIACWSMVTFLQEQHPEGLACVNDRLHGIKDAEGLPDGSNLLDKHRAAFTECLGMSYPAFDLAWREWAMQE